MMQTAALVVTEQEAPQLETKQEPHDLEEQGEQKACRPTAVLNHCWEHTIDGYFIL